MRRVVIRQTATINLKRIQDILSTGDLAMLRIELPYSGSLGLNLPSLRRSLQFGLRSVPWASRRSVALSLYGLFYKRVNLSE